MAGESMNVKIISDNIAWDGSSYFCRRCGKAGYDGVAKVKGHLAMCPGKAVQKGVVPQLPATSWQPVATGLNKDLEDSSASWLPPAPGPSYQLAEIASVDGRLSRLENEYNHMLVANNVSSGDWLSNNKGILIVAGAVVLVALLLRENKLCNCEASGKKSSNGIGSTLLAKGAGKFLDRSIDKVFS